jgi:hypothetical protein
MVKFVMKRTFALAALAAIVLLTPMARVGAEPSYPAFTTDRSKVETEAQDQVWKRDLDKACAPFRDQRAYTEAESQECQRLADHEPRCLSYKDFAGIYLKMREEGAVATDVAKGLEAMQKNTQLYPPDFSSAVRRLFQTAFFTDRKQLGTVEEFSARAYRACMSGHLL